MGINLSKNEEDLTKEIIGKVQFEKNKADLGEHAISLSKSVVDISKKVDIDLSGLRANVVVVLDYSASMSSLYQSGVVQATLNRLVPIGLTFDDDDQLEVFLFENEYRKLEPLTLPYFDSYVRDIIYRSGYHMGGTCYAPVLDAIINGEKIETVSGVIIKRKTITRGTPIVQDDKPTLVIFITDGENSDPTDTTEIIREASDKNLFIQFIGIGNETFTYLSKLDNLPGRARDNTGFTKMESLMEASDEELYNTILFQFANWLKGLQ